jgi:hypothetical protein
MVGFCSACRLSAEDGIPLQLSHKRSRIDANFMIAHKKLNNQFVDLHSNSQYLQNSISKLMPECKLVLALLVSCARPRTLEMDVSHWIHPCVLLPAGGQPALWLCCAQLYFRRSSIGL